MSDDLALSMPRQGGGGSEHGLETSWSNYYGNIVIPAGDPFDTTPQYLINFGRDCTATYSAAATTPNTSVDPDNDSNILMPPGYYIISGTLICFNVDSPTPFASDQMLGLRVTLGIENTLGGIAEHWFPFPSALMRPDAFQSTFVLAGVHVNDSADIAINYLRIEVKRNFDVDQEIELDLYISRIGQPLPDVPFL